MSATLKRIIALSAALFGMAVTHAHAETIVSVTQTSYDANGRAVCSATRMNPAIYGALPSDPCTLGTTSTTYGDDRITKTIYDTAGQATQVIQAYGTSVQRVYSTVAYSNNGQVTDQIDANGNRSHMVYDGVDRLKELDYPSTTRPSAFNPATQATALSTAGAYSTTDYEQYAYNDNNNPTYRRRRDAQVLNDCFDALGRVTVHYVHAQSGCTATGGAADVYTTYDGLGRITSKRFASTSGTGVTYVYDGLGRVTSTTDMNSRTVGYQYNVASARTQLTFPDATAIGYGLDNANRITTVGLNATSGLFAVTYDNLGNRTQLNRGAGAAVTNYTYDAFGRLSTFNDDVTGTANDITWTFSSRNPANQIITWGASSTVYDYKETANTTVNQTYDGLNRDAAIAAVSGGYDARGNLTKDATRTMTYDVENRLLTTVGTGVNVALVYDPEGRLAKYSTDGGTTYTTFLYDDTNLIREYAGATTTVNNTYVFGPSTDEPVVWYSGAGTTTKRYLIANYQGSIIGYTDSAGNLATVYKYGPYGEPKDISNNDSWSGARFRYTGQTMLYEARLYYYKARVYDPVYGHFMQTDPIGSKDDLDLYAYVGGDPINESDPTGLFAMGVSSNDGAKLAGDYAEATGKGGENISRSAGNRSDKTKSNETKRSSDDVERALDDADRLNLAITHFATLVRGNKRIGLTGEMYAQRELIKSGWTGLIQHVGIRNWDSELRIYDFMGYDPTGALSAVEIKTNGAVLTARQELIDEDVSKRGGRVLNPINRLFLQVDDSYLYMHVYQMNIKLK